MFLAVIVFIFICFANNRPAYSQTSQAVVRGIVRDPSGAVIRDAQITLTNTETGVSATTKTNDGGSYLFENVNPGTYTLEAKAQDFTSKRLLPFVLQVNQTASLDFSLMTGQVSQVVEVNAVGSGLEASTTELGLTLDSKQISNIPIDSRNFTALTLTAPGVSPIVVSGSQTGQYTTAVGPSIIPSFNGQSNRSDLFVVDGILDSETFGNAYAVQPIIDAIQDMKLQSHNDSAEFGGSTGGTINIATKSGTNALHGSLWEYYKEPALQAVPYFSTEITPLHQNQFGGEAGGPIIIPKLYNGRNKTFFFGAYEGFRFTSPNTDYFLVPTAAELSGDFTADAPIYDPATTTCDAALVCSRQQFSYNGVLNKIDPARLSQGDIYYAKNAIPQPASASIVLPGGDNAYQNAPSIQSLNSYDFRIDETIGQKNSAFFRMMILKGSQTSGREQLPGVTQTDAYSYVGSFEHVFSASTILHVQGGRTYESRPFTQRFQGIPSDLASKVGFPAGLTAGYSTLGTITPGFNVDSHFDDLGDFANPEVTAADWSVKADLTRVFGRHTLKFGAEYNSIGEKQNIEWAQEEMRAQETNSLVDGTSGNAVASFMIGVPGAFTKRNVVESISPGGVMSYYGQDTFQATPSLTLNFGLRYDLAFIPSYGRPGDDNQYVGNFDFNNGTYIVLKTPPSCAQTGNAPCIPTPDGTLPDHVVQSPDGRVLQNQYDNFQPRLGLAWRMSPKTALRAGIGLAFDNYAGLVQNIRGVSGNWPSVGQIAQSNINSPVAGSAFPGYTVSSLPALSALPAPTPFDQFNWFIDPKAKDAYSIQYNFGVQRELARTTIASATYVGSLNRRLDVGGYYNVAATPGPGDPATRRPYPYISPTFYSRSNGTGNYNALQLQLVRSFDNGLASTIAYTWSKSLDTGCSGFFGSEGCSIQQIYNIAAEYSVSAFDVTHNLTGTLNYELPFGRGKMVNIDSGFLNAIVGGWQVNAFARLHSGTPYSLNIQTDIANIGNTYYERPNRIGNPTPVHRTLNEWINPAAYAYPANYTYGNSGRNSLRTQFFQGYDIGAFKEFSYHERYRLRFNMEAFNALNHPIFGQPNSTFGASNFGTVSTTASEQRTTQLSAKILF